MLQLELSMDISNGTTLVLQLGYCLNKAVLLPKTAPMLEMHIILCAFYRMSNVFYVVLKIG